MPTEKKKFLKNKISVGSPQSIMSDSRKLIFYNICVCELQIIDLRVCIHVLANTSVILK